MLCRILRLDGNMSVLTETCEKFSIAGLQSGALRKVPSTYIDHLPQRDSQRIESRGRNDTVEALPLHAHAL